MSRVSPDLSFMSRKSNQKNFVSLSFSPKELLLLFFFRIKKSNKKTPCHFLFPKKLPVLFFPQEKYQKNSQAGCADGQILRSRAKFIISLKKTGYE